MYFSLIYYFIFIKIPSFSWCPSELILPMYLNHLFPNLPYNASLLQQTLHNQHVTNNTTTPTQTSNSNFVTSAKQNKSLQQTQVNANAAKATVTNQEQQAKNILCNW